MLKEPVQMCWLIKIAKFKLFIVFMFLGSVYQEEDFCVLVLKDFMCFMGEHNVWSLKVVL